MLRLFRKPFPFFGLVILFVPLSNSVSADSEMIKPMASAFVFSLPTGIGTQLDREIYHGFIQLNYWGRGGSGSFGSGFGWSFIIRNIQLRLNVFAQFYLWSYDWGSDYWLVGGAGICGSAFFTHKNGLTWGISFPALGYATGVHRNTGHLVQRVPKSFLNSLWEFLRFGGLSLPVIFIGYRV